MAHLRRDIEALKRGEAIEQPVYDFTTHDRKPGVTKLVEARPVVIIEGIHVLSDMSFAALFDLTVFVDAPAQQRQQAPVTQQPASEANPKREWAVKLKAAVNYGSLAVDEVWAMVPAELKQDMDSFYKEQYMKSQSFDAPVEPPAQYEIPNEMPPASIDDM